MYRIFSGVATTRNWPHTALSPTLPEHFVPAGVAGGDRSEALPEDRLAWFKHFNAVARATVAERPELQSLHGTVLVGPAGDGILLIAERSGGKSTAAVVWAQVLGLPVLCDDLVVLGAGHALVGPRLLPVRPRTARVLGLSTVGHCLTLKEAPVRVPVRSVCLLRTGSAPGSEALSPRQARYELSRRLFDTSSLDVVCATLRDARFHRVTRSFEEADPTLTARRLLAMQP